VVRPKYFLPNVRGAVVRRPLIVPTLLLTLLASVGCTTNAGRCVDGVCSISLSGEQTVDVEFGSFERSLRVAPTEAGAVTVSARGEQARLASVSPAPSAGSR
jgi:hypothetical protein